MFIAPAGTPLALSEIAAGFLQGAHSQAPLETLHRELTRLSATDRCWTFSSGRAAMVVALRAMHSVGGPKRTKVIIPGYTCYSVAASVQRSGLTPLFCDIDPATLSLDLDALRALLNEDVLAIITANLYGVPNESDKIEALARQHGVFMLDDAAQALGAQLNGRPSGGFGDVGLFSFDKGKNVATMQGGALVARSSSLAHAIEVQWIATPMSRAKDTMATAVKLPPYALLLRPTLYGWVRALPGLGLGQTRYELDYPITRYSPVLAGLAARLVKKLDAINGARVANARRLEAALERSAGAKAIQPPPGATPVYVRLPLLVNEPSKRDALIRALETAGVGATSSYPSALVDVPEVKARWSPQERTPGARHVAERIVTLPTQAYAPASMPDLVRRIFERVLGAST